MKVAEMMEVDSITTSPKTNRRTAPPGFLPFKSHNRPLQELTKRELNNRYFHNKSVLDDRPGPSTAGRQRLLNEQTAIENMLNIEHMQDTLHRTHTTEDDPMGEPAATASVSRVVDTKRRVLERYYDKNQQRRGTTVALGLYEAIALEQQAHAAEMERKKRKEEKRFRSRCSPRSGENLTQEDGAYMDTKSTESDEENEDWNESDEYDDDPATWFTDFAY